MSQMMMPAAWATLFEQIKPFGETDLGQALKTAGELLGFSSAQINDSGRLVARIGGIRDLSGADAVALPHSGCELSILWDEAPTQDQQQGVQAFANVMDLALIAKDRRSGQSQTPMIAPSGAKDRLTNTIDRDAFVDYLDIEFGAGPTHATVMSLGLDGMSVVNETMGHTVGDVVIAEVADRLRETLRSCDIISRLGGDVFGIYCPNTDIETASKLAVRLQAAIARPIPVKSNELRITSSVGVAARGKGEKAQATIANGDTALQAARSQGPAELMVYDGVVRMRNEDRRLLAAELVEALDLNQLATGLEPIVHLPGGSIVGVEAHVVWNHPTRGNIDRSEFMDLAELIGRVADVERAVLEFALSGQNDPSMTTGINISASTFHDSAAIGWVVERLKSAPSKIIVEVSESTVSTGGTTVVRHLQAMRDAGASIVLDDFGLSFASLRTLHAFQFDGVKLHVSLLNEGDSQRMVSIAKGVYASAESIGFDVVHCGVETDSDIRLLMSLDKALPGHGFYAQGKAVRDRVAAVSA